MGNSNGLVQNMILELRRGVLVIAVLSQLEQEQYGYSLLKLLSDQNLEIDQGTLYPLLRRLEAQGLVRSNWRVGEEARPRRYYIMSAQGREVLTQLKREWSELVTTVQKMLMPVRRTK
jgi:PadR family transcriptional regulator, regulatory protein PadR